MDSVDQGCTEPVGALYLGLLQASHPPTGPQITLSPLPSNSQYPHKETSSHLCPRSPPPSSCPPSLERETSERIMAALLGPDRRLLDPAPEALEALTLEGVRGAVRHQLRPENLEVR